MSEKKNIDDLREALFSTIAGVKDGSIDVDQAKVISELSQVIVNSAKVEVDHEKATGQKGSGFLEKSELPKGITGITQHRLRG